MNSIMLVDDERWVRTALRRTIEKLDLPFVIVHECGNGLEALDWLKNNHADLILTDIRMPVMDGLSFAKQFRRRRRVAEVIIISVHDDFPCVQEALRNGVFDYLLKPVEPSELKACLEKWIEHRREKPQFEWSISQAVSEHPSPIQRVLQYIEESPPGEITLTEAARRVHMNPSYLSQLFKQKLNKNFVDYLTEVRMAEAKHLLADTTLRISEIADRLGYSDLAYFSNTFKKMVGCTPSEYRKRNQSLKAN